MAARPRPNSVEYGNSKTTTLLPSAKCACPLFQGRTGCGGRPSGWHDIVTCQRLVLKILPILWLHMSFIFFWISGTVTIRFCFFRKKSVIVPKFRFYCCARQFLCFGVFLVNLHCDSHSFCIIFVSERYSKALASLLRTKTSQRRITLELHLTN